ncbi:MAG: 23S rRNA (pseudouridine(1915)-N(3))-methyltransferase RlmH [Bacteroidota bacterium]
MRIRLIAVGRLKEEYLRAGAADFTARLRPYAQLELVEVADSPDPLRPSPAATAQLREAEATAILQRIQTGEILVALDPRGQALTSDGLAEFLRPHDAVGARLAFVIGGSWGLGQAVLARAQAAISLSPMTFPHGLARLILLEQLYRAFKILRRETYHK